MSCDKSQVNLISLDDNVLLHLFEYLSWIDSISLAATSKRMKTLKFWVKKQNEEFDLKKYVDKATVPIEKILPVIGPYIRVAKITEQVINKSFIEKCINIKTIKIDGCISKSVAITLNTWMKQSKIEIITVGQGFEDYVEELLDGIEGLNAFIFDSCEKLPSNFFHRNPAIQHLLLTLGDYYELSLDLSPLLVLYNLQSLFLTIESTVVLNDVRKYVKIDYLKEFSINILDDNWDADIWDSFATYLSENSKLDKLRMNGYGSIGIDEKTFLTITKLFDLTSLWLDVSFSWKDFSTILNESAAPRLKYLRLEWPMSWCNSTKIGLILKMWTTVEAICLNTHDESDLLHHFKDEFFSDILNISDNRPGLKLHIFSSEIYFNFIWKRYNVIIEGKEFCSCKDSFQSWDHRLICNS